MALSRKAEFKADMVERERGFYPFIVAFHTLEVEGASREIESPAMPLDGIQVDLPIGRVCYSGRNRRNYHFAALPIWDCRIVRSSSLGDRLFNATLALEEPRQSIGRAVFGSGLLYWQVDPASGVRPRLPDRADLLDSPALTEAVQQIVEALIDRVSEAVKALVQDLPDEFGSLSGIPGLDEGPHAWLLNSHLRVVEDCLPHFGFHEVRCENPLTALVGVSINGDETEVDFYCDATSIFLRHPLRVRDQTTALALCRQGKWAVADEESELTARIHGLRLNLTRRPPTQWQQEQDLPGALVFPLVAFAERIEVPGVCDLPFLLLDSPDDSWPLGDHPGLEPTDSIAMVFAGSPLDFLRTFDESNFAAGLLHYLHEAGELWDWAQFNTTYDGLDEKAFLDRVADIVLNGYLPERAAQLEQALACRDAATALRKAHDELTRLRCGLMAGQGALEDRELVRYDALQAEIEAIRDLLRARSRELDILAGEPAGQEPLEVQ
jgi:hypothetical protein